MQLLHREQVVIDLQVNFTLYSFQLIADIVSLHKYSHNKCAVALLRV